MGDIEDKKPVSSEMAADLAALQAMAAEDQPAAPVGAEPAPAVDPGEAWAVLPAMVGGVLAIAMPELRQVYTPEACNAWGTAMVPVADKYGWSPDSFSGPEFGLLAASLPLAIGTFGAFKDKRAELAKSEEKPAPAVPSEVPGADRVIIGSPVAE